MARLERSAKDDDTTAAVVAREMAIDKVTAGCDTVSETAVRPVLGETLLDCDASGSSDAESVDDADGVGD